MAAPAQPGLGLEIWVGIRFSMIRVKDIKVRKGLGLVPACNRPALGSGLGQAGF